MKVKVKGYITAVGYMGLVNGHYVLFATETEYHEFIKEMEEEE